MIRQILAAMLALFAAAAFAATDVNTATQAELESVKASDPSISTKILDARKSGPFKDWGDLVTRVKGVGDKNSAEFSAAGLTVNGAAKSGAPADPAAVRKSEKPAAKTTAKSAAPAAIAPGCAPAVVPTPAAVAPSATASAPVNAADKKAAAKQEREAKKAAKADEKARKKAAKMADGSASGASAPAKK